LIAKRPHGPCQLARRHTSVDLLRDQHHAGVNIPTTFHGGYGRRKSAVSFLARSYVTCKPHAKNSELFVCIALKTLSAQGMYTQRMPLLLPDLLP